MCKLSESSRKLCYGKIRFIVLVPGARLLRCRVSEFDFGECTVVVVVVDVVVVYDVPHFRPEL